MSEGIGVERDCGQRCDGVRLWQLVRLGVAGRAWASLLGVFRGGVGRARMACGRCEYGRRCARRMTQEVSVMRHLAFRGTLGRQELVGKVVVWGRKPRGMQECGLRRSCCVTSRCLCFLRYAESVGSWCGTRSGVWECEADGPSCGTLVLRVPEQEVR